MKKGIVYLVGAGPGDPGLITLKGVGCLRRADVVVYDYLANKSLLNFAPAKARFLYVGKKGSTHSKDQGEINALLVREAQGGKTVVRLKGGDPFVFGRGGEEAEALAEAGIPFEVVPGVTSAVAVPAYAGIPVTHRDFTSSVTFVSGHEEELGRSGIDWPSLAKIGTIVFLMGWKNLSKIAQNLMEAGRTPETPVALIEWGTHPRQKKVIGTLRSIVDDVKRVDIRPPTIIVIGEVVALADKISWFDSKPLFGRRILVTRSRGQASDLSQRLEEKGAEVIEIPTIEIRPPSSWGKIDRAIRSLSRYDWLVFTSANGVESFFNRLGHLKKDLRDLHGVKIAAVGPATARPVEGKGIRVDLVADEFRGEGLAAKMATKRIRGQRVLIAQAAQARPVLRDELVRLGAKVEVVEAYRSTCPREGKEELRTLLESGCLDLVAFASSLTVENFATMAGSMERLRQIPVACIGPVTARTARKYRLNVAAHPKRSTMTDLVETIGSYFRGRAGEVRGRSSRRDRT